MAGSVRIRRILRHDWPAIALVAASLVAIAAYLAGGVGGEGGSGYRVIDFEAVRRLVDQGQLSRHEARWYHREGGHAENPSPPARSNAESKGGGP